MFPIHLDFGPFSPYFYEGAYFAISILIAAYWAYKRQKKLVNEEKHFEGIVTWSLVSALIFARLSHFVFWEPEYFFSNPGVFFRLSGGNSIVGGLLGGMFGGWLYTRRKKISYFRYFAIFSPPVLLGQAVGRIGCFLNGDAYGRATDLPWGVQFPRYGITIPSFEKNTRISSDAWRWSYENGLVDQASLYSASLHPTQLYEFAGDIILMVLVLMLIKKVWDSAGDLALVFYLHVGGYSFLRFQLEFLRADNDTGTYLGMTGVQIGLLLVSVAAAVMTLIHQQKKPASA
jgi:phosphatidylglycerol:prolipoprotein diacylglycerol transferase